MNEDAVVEILQSFISKQFPKICSNCNMKFDTLKEYLQKTTHLGKPVSYDANMDEWQPEKPLGAMSYANCVCGNTLVIGTKGMGLMTMWRLLSWARTETRNRGISTQDLLAHLREKIDERVLQDAE
jgi:hypothetical protein